MPPDEPPPPRLTRTFILVLIALLAVYWFVTLLQTWNISGGYFGWNIGTDGTTVTYVTPGSPAAQAGIRKGDRIDWSTLPLLGRANTALVQDVQPGTSLHVTVRSADRTRAVTLRSIEWPAVVQDFNRALVFTGLVLIAIGIVLVHLRPTRMTWGFLLSCLTLGDQQYLPVLAVGDPARYLALNLPIAVLCGLSAGGVLVFMSRFPADRPRGPLALLDRAALSLGAIVTILLACTSLIVLRSSTPPPTWLLFTYQYLAISLLGVIALAALITSYVLTKGSDRQRILPVLVAYVVFVACGMATSISGRLVTDVASVAIFSGLTMLSMLALAYAVANGVIRHRVMDLSFAISRTLVYTILTTMLVGAYVFIEFLSAKFLEHLQIALALEACTALAFGIWLHSLHTRVERFVDRAFFRRRHLAEARLERTARALSRAETVGFIDEALVVEPSDAMALASAAVFRGNGDGPLVRVRDNGWQARNAATLTRDDHIVVTLSAELRPIDLSEIRWRHTDVPSGLFAPLLALPLVADRELFGLVLYGGHTGGEAIDPDEKETLMRLAAAATAAYQHVEAKRLETELDALRSENAVLHREQHLLREIVAALRSPS